MRSSTILLLSAGFRFLLIRSKSDIQVEILQNNKILIFQRKFKAELASGLDFFGIRNPDHGSRCFILDSGSGFLILG